MRLGIWIPDISFCCPLHHILSPFVGLCTFELSQPRQRGCGGGGSQRLRLPPELTRVSEDALSLEMACLPKIILPSLTVGGTLWDQVAADCRINLLV